MHMRLCCYGGGRDQIWGCLAWHRQPRGGHGGIRQEKASSRRFRTIQVCPKDLPRDRW